MEERPRMRSTPFPLQTIFGERGEGEKKVLRNGFREKFKSIDVKTQFAKTFMVSRQRNVESPRAEIFLKQENIADSLGILHTVLHQPRLSTSEKEIIIINIEGILANCHRREVSIRSESVQFLKDLNFRYQLILVSGWKLARFLKLISYLSSKGIYISAAYKQVSPGSNTTEEFDKKRHDWYLDYSRIYKDFKVTSLTVKKVVVLVALLTNPEEIVQPHFVVGYTGSLRPTFYVRKAPVPTMQAPFVPTTLLVPHMALFPLHLNPVVEALRQYFASRTSGSFYHSHLSYFSCSVLHKELLYLYHKSKPRDAVFQSFLLLKSGNFSELLLLHKESYIQRVNCENLLEFTLGMNM